jgi:hypothetical protein
VRAADVKKNLVGRMTATARHLTDPANKVYFYDMEGPVYEVDVHTLVATKLFTKPVPGWHGKGAYTGQGVLVVANNGAESAMKEDKNWELPLAKWSKGPEEAGALAEWNGKSPGTEEGWKIISRRQHVEVTGPGGIYGATNDADPIWSTGWDKRSVMLDVRDASDNAWHTYRLPKASHTYDPSHGWYTEWPRIREIVPAKDGRPARLMMTMHGTMFDFPQTFRPGKTAGIRPIATHLRYVPDFCGWNGRVVISSDDTSIMQNSMAGVSQSNLWFGTPEQIADFGFAAGWGGPWVNDAIEPNKPSEPYLFAGYSQRVLHVAQKSAEDVTFTVEVDEKGDGQWKPSGTTIKVPANGYAYHVFPADAPGEWVRLTADKPTTATAYFHYLTPSKFPAGKPDAIFAGLAPIDAAAPKSAGILRPGQDKLLHYVARDGDAAEKYYTLEETLAFKPADDAGKVAAIHKANDIKTDFAVDDASVVVTYRDAKYRLPKSSAAAFDKTAGVLRGVREVESERFLANVHGTFYEAPRGTNGPDWRAAKPIASHTLAINDFCTWRGLLVLSGVSAAAKPDGHVFRTADGGPGALWFGAVDDLWKLGKPTGRGGPWKDTAVVANAPSDPYLMTNYDHKTLTLTHDAATPVTFTIQVDPTNTGAWQTYAKIEAKPGTPTTHAFPEGFNAYWVRLIADKPCKATATFVYE